MDGPFSQAVLASSAQTLDSLPIVSGSTNPGDYGTSQQQETRTNMDSTPAPFPPPPSGRISRSTRVYTRPCRCGKSECMWLFIYLDQMIYATHEVLGSLPPILTRSTNPTRPKLSSRQKETFATPSIRPDCDDSEAGLLRFLEREPWADVRPEKLVCLGCGCDFGTRSPGSWLWHRNSCEGIDNAILRSVVDVWEAEVAESSLIEEL